MGEANGGETRRGYRKGLDALHYVDGTCVEMLRKNTLRRNNTSGVVGVNWDKAKRRWRASICFKGEHLTLGRFERFEDAVACRKKAERELHGAFLEAMSGSHADRARAAGGGTDAEQEPQA